MTKTFKEIIAGIRTAIYGREVREDIAQGMEYVEGFATTAAQKAEEAANGAAAAENALRETTTAKTEAVQAIRDEKTASLDAIADTKNAALDDVASSTKTAADAAAEATKQAQSSAASAQAAAQSQTAAATKAGEASTSAGVAFNSRQAAEKAQKAAENAAALAGTRASTDKTLSIENAPADAKATGDALEGKADKSTVQDESGNAIFYSKAEVEAKIKEILAAQREKDLARIKFWVSDDPTSPASFIGGTWERVEGEFIIGASDTYPAGATGGEESVKLTKENIPVLSSENGVAAVNTVGNNVYVPQWGWIYTATQVANSDGYNSYGAEWPYVGTNDADMQNVNNMPPYCSMYIWRRVA